MSIDIFVVRYYDKAGVLHDSGRVTWERARELKQLCISKGVRAWIDTIDK